MKRRKHLVSLLTLALLVSACSPLKIVESSGERPTPIISLSTPEVTEIVEDASTAVPLQPTGRSFFYEGVSFYLDPGYKPSGQVVPEEPGSPDGPYWEVHPEYISITLEDYPVRSERFKPMVAIYPVEDYRRLSPHAGETLQLLVDLLSEQPPVTDQVPSLPVMNSGQIFHSNLAYLAFQNGIGVSFLGYYSQAADPITNKDLVYVFQGLTNGGRYAVSAFLPVNHPSLPNDPESLAPEEIGEIMQDYEAYLTSVSDSLSLQWGESFTPSLEELNLFIMSLSIE